MRQTISRTKPWEAIGMSGSTWYRRGQPTVWPPPDAPPPLLQYLMMTRSVSRRTAQRMSRVLLADRDLFRVVEQDAGTWGQAELMIKHPDVHRSWRAVNGLPWPVPERNFDDEGGPDDRSTAR